MGDGRRRAAPLQSRELEPFTRLMQISGNATGIAYDVAVAKKAQQSTREQGKQAVELIQSATSSNVRPPSNDVGTRLNVVA